MLKTLNVPDPLSAPRTLPEYSQELLRWRATLRPWLTGNIPIVMQCFPVFSLSLSLSLPLSLPLLILITLVFFGVCEHMSIADGVSLQLVLKHGKCYTFVLQVAAPQCKKDR